ncbi:uncharacterized protein LOC125676044 isoform X2 [Ostrea edulis]|uniref:uncharacterized protein LOC125676044 isoform X2 n=1 Tax=Ostrea edulis TaxID=37623 RepID=UPI0024AF20DA|nr:uncharacterized protein LOC125676044 isoform X2 [Ostrea edulis]
MAVQGLQSTEFSLMCIYMSMFVIDFGIAQMCGSKQSHEGIETFTVSCQLSDETPANTKRDVEDSNALAIALLCGNGVLIGVIAGVVVLLRRNRNKNTRRTSPEKKPRPTQLANNSDQTGYSKSTDIYGLKDNPLYQPANDIQHYTYIDTSLNTLQKPAIISDQSQNSKETSRSIPTHSVQQNGSSSNEEDGLKRVTLYQPDDDNHTYTYIDTEMNTSRGPHCLT